MNEVARGRLYIVAAAILWSTSGALTKLIELPSLPLTVDRSLAGGLALLVWVMLSGRPRTWHPAMLGMILIFAAMSILFIAANKMTTSANAVLLQYTAPLWMVLASVFWLGERVRKRSLVAVLIAVAGIAVLVRGAWEVGETHRWGVLSGLTSGFFFAGVAISLRIFRRHDALWLATLNLLGGGLVLAAFAAIWNGLGHGSLAEWIGSIRDYALVTLFGIGQMAIPYVLFGMGLRTVSAQEAGILTLIEPVLNPMWTFLAVGEQPDRETVMGGSVLMLSLVIEYLPGNWETSRSAEDSNGTVENTA